MMGEPTVNALETGGEVGFTMFTTFKTKGIMGIWEFLKDKFSDLKETIVDAIAHPKSFCYKYARISVKHFKMQNITKAIEIGLAR